MHPSIERPSVAAAATRRAPRLMGGITALGAAGLLVVTAGAGSVLAAQGDDTLLIDLVDKVSPSVVTIQVTVGGSDATDDSGTSLPQGGGSGSGVIIDPSGLILTNRHVAGDATGVTVILKDGTQLEGETVGVDTLTDFAFVKVDATDLPAASLGESSGVQVGQLAIAMGNPLGDFPGTITAGIVSGLDREITVTDQMGGDPENLRHLIQTDAAINPGNSGGPLVDANGDVVGINTAASTDANGIGFALPIDLAKPIIDQVLAGQPIERPYIGIRYQDLDAQIAADNELTVTLGAWVHVAADGQQAVLANSPAKDAGLKDGDIITAIDGQAVDREHPLDLLLLQHAPGDKVDLSVLRGDETITVTLTLGTRPAAD
jgi:S1-C subfamily serine protease